MSECYYSEVIMVEPESRNSDSSIGELQASMMCICNNKSEPQLK